MRIFSRAEQDQILNDMRLLTDDIIRLQTKQDAQGLSEWEFKTLQMKQNKLSYLRRMIWNSGH